MKPPCNAIIKSDGAGWGTSVTKLDGTKLHEDLKVQSVTVRIVPDDIVRAELVCTTEVDLAAFVEAIWLIDAKGFEVEYRPVPDAAPMEVDPDLMDTRF